jgi:hypothetical protein
MTEKRALSRSEIENIFKNNYGEIVSLSGEELSAMKKAIDGSVETVYPSNQT